MLQRIYGTAWATEADSKRHLELLEEAKRRDHRKLGKELDLWSFHAIAPGSPFFHPKGAFVYNALIGFIRGLYERYGYGEVITPQIADVELWKRSGHYENFRDNMFFCEIDEREFGVKPMNCPGHTFVYGSAKRSYRELPLRYADFSKLHRYEKSGVLHGLTRVRTFSQDDAHIFCTPDAGAGGDHAGDRDGGCRPPRVRVRGHPGLSLDSSGAAHGERRDVGPRRGGTARGARGERPPLRDQPRRRRVLRSEDRLPLPRCAAARMAADDDSARLRAARAVRPHVRVRRRGRKSGR